MAREFTPEALLKWGITDAESFDACFGGDFLMTALNSAGEEVPAHIAAVRTDWVVSMPGGTDPWRIRHRAHI